MTYPNITSDKCLPFKELSQRLLEDKNYLDQESCPYPELLKSWLKSKFLPHEVSVALEQEEAFDPLDPDSWDDSAKKSRQLYADLETLRKDTKDTGESIQIIKAQAGLLERLIAVGDKSLGHRETAEFRQVVLGILEDILTPDQRTQAMARLGAE
ncbi:hypothetical protein [Telmatospirillum sp.]|uniref:hypothetical protein n=1 Tax=Telmatospirillum sp. TaxID=2079197 RepID=UPI00283CC17C|nr:hypothetical protein [Telmatospirillum sp.]MDR3436422.1 hypothetical protein [Telmatospirillum sp.]